jgi:uncharacterized repeat protein (TIGR02543 family)
VVKGNTLAEPNAPVKEGSTFEGWYKEAAFANKVTFPHTVTSDMTLYAKWTKEEEPGENNAFTIRNTAEWNVAVNIIKAGNSTEYILTVEGTVSVPPTTGTDDGYITATTFGKAKTVTLAGSGTLVLSGKGFLACIDGQKLIIDGPTLKGISDNTEPLVHIEDNAALELKSGKITGNTNTDSNGGGVKLRGTGTVFTMSGGEITGNSASGGGGVDIGSSATFTLSGGTISGNTAERGGGIRLAGGGYGKEAYFYMTGGVIKSNTATAPSSDYPGGGGVALYSSTVFSKTGGIIYGSDATDADKNRVVNSNSGSAITTRGSAVVHHIDNVIGDIDDIFRETTLGETDDLNTKDETTNWGK